MQKPLDKKMVGFNECELYENNRLLAQILN
jgi:hypothetical protein